MARFIYILINIKKTIIYETKNVYTVIDCSISI
jgi:hypothetical protein